MICYHKILAQIKHCPCILCVFVKVGVGPNQEYSIIRNPVRPTLQAVRIYVEKQLIALIPTGRVFLIGQFQIAHVLNSPYRSNISKYNIFVFRADTEAVLQKSYD